MGHGPDMHKEIKDEIIYRQSFQVQAEESNITKLSFPVCIAYGIFLIHLVCMPGCMQLHCQNV